MIAHVSPNRFNLSSDVLTYETAARQSLKLELVTNANCNRCLARIAAGSAENTWVVHVLGANVSHECVQIGTLRQRVVCTQAELSQLTSVANVIKCSLRVVDGGQQFQSCGQRVRSTDFESACLFGVIQNQASRRSDQSCRGQSSDRRDVLWGLDQRVVTIHACRTELVASNCIQHFDSCLTSSVVCVQCASSAQQASVSTGSRG